MAKRTEVKVTDDITGEAGAETVRFSFEGLSFEIDLVQSSRDAFIAALQPYMDAGTRMRTSNGVKVAARRVEEPRDFDMAELRAWAEANDIAVPERGRIPGDVVTMFKNRNNQHEPVRKGKRSEPAPAAV